MKVVIAIDSFKGSLTSMEAGNAAALGVLRALPGAEIIVKPLADGGEGTVEALVEGLGGKTETVRVTGPLGTPVDALYGCLLDSRTAVLEMAKAAGLPLIPPGQKDPLSATSCGVGEMILDAAGRGYRNFIIGIGGSATNDGGLGMLRALGFRFLDASGQDVGEGGRALSHISRIVTDTASPLLRDCRFQVACDVTNPLCGENGATYIYGPQKGVTPATRVVLEQGMQHYARLSSLTVGRDHSSAPGAGAAGGLGFAFLSYLNASLIPGVRLILDAIHLEDELQDADIVLTGEGRLDAQTAMGKAPAGVAELAKKYGVKVVAIAGSVTKDALACNPAGIDAFFPVVRGITTLEEAMCPENARENITDTVEQIFRLLS